jgi:hypothetical protein
VAVYYHGISLEVLRKTRRYPSEVSQYESNQVILKASLMHYRLTEAWSMWFFIWNANMEEIRLCHVPAAGRKRSKTCIAAAHWKG